MWYIELLPLHLRHQLIPLSDRKQWQQWVLQTLKSGSLLAHGLSVNYCYHNERTLLFGAIFYDRNDIANHLLSLAADINAREESRICILHIAVRCDNIEMVQKLLQLGANVETVDKYGITILIPAAKSGSFELLQILLAEPKIVAMRDCDHKLLWHRNNC